MPQALPQLDLSAFSASPDAPASRELVRRLREACRDPGFFYVTGHGVPPELDRAVMRVARRFFALPDDEKRALDIAASPHFRGYTPIGGELTKGRPDRREQLDVGAEELAEPTAPGDPAWRRLRGPNQWPAALPEMRPIVLEWMRVMDRLGLTLLRAIALGLGQPGDYFDRYFTPRGDPHLKIIHYPPLGDDGADQGVGMHHDSGLLSFVLQDEVGGLEVEHGGQIVHAEPRPGTYVVNLGEMMQAATAGYLRATPHRVTSPRNGLSRLSIAYFFHPRLESVFEPIPLPDELRQHARGGQNADPADPVFACFGDNYLKIRLRSHPNVAARHYR
ncbi:MAG TPA: 2-oxoglutarate and iron-dependent oxygenase domain-containing protein [Gammaproteobacteria bacterium]